MRRIFCLDLGPWPDLALEAQQLRRAVFVQEQHISLSEITDAADTTALHVLARDPQRRAVGTGRLVNASPGVGKVEFLAVSASVRGQGVGRVMLTALTAGACERGMHAVMLFAQHNALQFYLNEGFKTRGPVFEAVGRPHQEMHLNL